MIAAQVLLIDDDTFVRSSLTAGLSAFGINVVGAVANASSALELIANTATDVAVVDLDLGPGPSGIDICYSLRKIRPTIGLVLLTSYTDPKIADSKSLPLPKGCRFISKSKLEDFKTLVNEILAARAKPFSSTYNTNREPILTSTQLDVLRMVAGGLSTLEIAEIRGVSAKSIEGIISKIHSALGLQKSKSLNQRVQLAREFFFLSGKKPPGA